jgi:hypothetical protein
MIRVAADGYYEEILENPDINALAEGNPTREAP